MPTPLKLNAAPTSKATQKKKRADASDSDSLNDSSESIGSEDEAYSLVSSYDAEVASKHVDNPS